MKVLLVDDNRKINEMVKTFLELKGYEIISAINGNEGLELIKNENFDLYIIDIHLPKINGLELVKHIRSQNLNIPIIMITASEEVDNFLEAFKNGCNEYIKKPFHLEELEVRINNLFGKSVTDIFKIDSFLSFDFFRQELLQKGKVVKLRKKENRLLSILLKNKNTTLSTEEIINFVWEDEKKDNYPLRQLVSSLRGKVPRIKKYIKSVSRIGYRFEM